jgi:hypothetical protein
MSDDTLDVPALQRLLDHLTETLDTPDLLDSTWVRVDAAQAAMLRTLSSRLPAIVEDGARLDWLEQAVPSGEFRRWLDAQATTRWEGTIRELIDTASANPRAARSIPAGTRETGQ